MLLDRGHEVATLSCGDRTFDERKLSVLLSRNANIERNPLGTLRNIRNFIYRSEAADSVKRLVNTFNPDVAHLHIFYGQLTSAILVALNRLRIPCVMTVHEYRMLCPVSTLYSGANGVCERCAAGNRIHAVLGRCNRGSALYSGLSAFEALVRDRYFAYADHICHFFMVSKFCFEKHRQYLPKLENKMSVLYNCINELEVSAEPSSVRHDAHFIYSGRLSREKGVYLLCEAFARRPTLELRIAGDGPLAGELISRYQHLSNVRFLGRLDPVELRREISGAYFSVVPSVWYENNPMAILESFARGTPVLGANIGGIPELIYNNRTGLLFDPSDIQSLLGAIDAAHAMSVPVRMEMGAAAIALIREQHNEEKYYRRVIAVYERVLNGSASANCIS